ncbi:MAG: UDP-N-acetylmuramoyl-L-alanine--D-glutamate ligase [Candidatus Rhabdochlamydia sp.]
MPAKAVVLGMGKSGDAVYQFLKEAHIEVIGIDDALGPWQHQDGLPVCQLDDISQVIVSPGIPLSHPLILAAQEKGIPVQSELDFALERLPSVTAIAITGTNGKTTSTLLLTHILKTAGYRVKMGGNVGIPLTSLIGQIEQDDIVVIEVSSYQLEIRLGRFFSLGIILNITPDHLERHTCFQDYAKIKCSLQQSLQEEGRLWVHSNVANAHHDQFERRYFTYGTDSTCSAWTEANRFYSQQGNMIDLSSLNRSFAQHDLENILAVWSVCEDLGLSHAVFLQGLQTFQKPLHRIEWIDCIKGVDYVNDSKGTNLDATIKAVNSIRKDVILIAGGVHKGSSYSLWKDSFHNKVKFLIVIGQAAELIEQELGPFFCVLKAYSMEQAVQIASHLAVSGDTVLLSPGCASFDMFTDYIHRGDSFKQEVSKLKQQALDAADWEKKEIKKK